MSEMRNTLEDMSDYEYMRVHSAPVHHNPGRMGPTSDTLLHEAERARRGLVYPDSWISAGIGSFAWSTGQNEQAEQASEGRGGV